ncbi:MAG: 30S ribosomal protein S21 [Fibrobacteres bacterium]|nr:30S ribosomal protein S21 [Fibrobacterota bacterium]
MIGVIVRSNEAFEKALKRFTKTCEKSGVLSDLRKNQYHEKPSEAKKRQKSQARRKAIKEKLIADGVIKPRPARNGKGGRPGVGGRDGGREGGRDGGMGGGYGGMR